MCKQKEIIVKGFQATGIREAITQACTVMVRVENLIIAVGCHFLGKMPFYNTLKKCDDITCFIANQLYSMYFDVCSYFKSFIHQLNICQKIAQISTLSGHFDDYTVSKCCGCCLTFLKHKIELFIKKNLMGRNFSICEIIRRAKLFVGRNFRHLAKNSSLSPDKVSPDKVTF